jgi:parallel beta-helix repeat protein
MSAVLTITNEDTTAGVITFNQPVPYDIGPGSRYFISDSQALLDQPGEWYFNKATQALYYHPTAGFNGGGAVVSGDLGGSSLINVSNAQNITIRGIGFSDVASQAETSDFSTAAININSSSGITIDGNQFANVAQGVSVTGSSYNNTISNNSFDHIWSQAINLEKHSYQNVVTNNSIMYSGEVFATSSAIYSYESLGNTISHNLIQFVPGIGIWETNDY